MCLASVESSVTTTRNVPKTVVTKATAQSTLFLFSLFEVGGQQAVMRCCTFIRLLLDVTTRTTAVFDAANGIDQNK